jgi:hypothetical protein
MRKLLTFLIALGAIVLSLAPAYAQVGQIPFWPPIQLGSTWTPASLSGLIAWYKADNDSTNVFSDAACTVPQTTNAANVLCWKDLSGNGYNLVNASGANRPTYVLAGLNGKPTVNFVALSSQNLRTAVGVAMGTGVSGSAFAIGTMNTGTNSFGRLVTYAPPSAADNSAGGFTYLFRQSTTNFFETEKGITVVVGSPYAAVSLATETRFGGIANGTTIQSYVNGATAGTAGSGSIAFTSGGYIALGSSIASGGGTGAALWDGNISEIIITNNAMSSGDIALLDAYLAARW